METPQRPVSPSKSQLEAPRRLRSPYLQDTGDSHVAIRIPRQLIESLPEITPRSRLSQTMVYNDEGSEMFRAVCERKCAKERLEAMTNRIQSLHLAEMRAQKKLEEVRKLTTAKAQLKEKKVKVRCTQEEEHRRQWRVQVQNDRFNTRLKVETERTEARERLVQAREALLKMKRVRVRQEQVEFVKRESGKKRDEMLSYLDEDYNRRVSRKASVALSIQRAHARNLSLDSENRTRVKMQFQTKKDTELSAKTEMERRIKELEQLEQRIVENLKKTFVSHEEEITKLELLVTKPRSPRLSSSVGFSMPKVFVTDDEGGERGATT